MDERYEEYDNGFCDNQENRYFETNKEIIDELNKLNSERRYFLKVIFAIGNYVENGDYERIDKAIEGVKRRTLK